MNRLMKQLSKELWEIGSKKMSFEEWYRLFNDEPTISPIAWCEVPTFDKE